MTRTPLCVNAFSPVAARRTTVAVTLLAASSLLGVTSATAYPPAVGILGRANNCLVCHVDNGPWKDDASIVVDVVDKESGKSLRQSDGTFLVEAKRGLPKTLLTIIGRVKGDTAPAPRRNAWLYVDPKTVQTSSLSKFAPGWEVNLPMACRMVGDKSDAYEGATITVLPMTVRPADSARDAELTLQIMLTSGDSVKGKAKEGMIGSYLERTVKLKVTE